MRTKSILYVFVFVLTFTLLVGCNNKIKTSESNNLKMQVTSSGIKDGMIDDKYGKKGTEFLNNMPTLSIPLSIKNPPAGTKTFAIVLEDYDSIPSNGFPWIHWSVANLTKNNLEEGESNSSRDFIEGTNSWSSPLIPNPLNRMQAARYGGMVPSDMPHTYSIKVYALDKKLNLNRGFYLNELYKEMEGHILEVAELKGIYSN